MYVDERVYHNVYNKVTKEFFTNCCWLLMYKCCGCNERVYNELMYRKAKRRNKVIVRSLVSEVESVDLFEDIGERLMRLRPRMRLCHPNHHFDHYFGLNLT